mmetsp:Transcript_13693/g.29393  ORF Transcript_13693/g.29393 Transcript_13693/m.29393 type:complete len:246 (-) Transcript_13693:847-1584(-)
MSATPSPTLTAPAHTTSASSAPPLCPMTPRRALSTAMPWTSLRCGCTSSQRCTAPSPLSLSTPSLCSSHTALMATSTGLTCCTWTPLHSPTAPCCPLLSWWHPRPLCGCLSAPPIRWEWRSVSTSFTASGIWASWTTGAALMASATHKPFQWRRQSVAIRTASTRPTPSHTRISRLTLARALPPLSCASTTRMSSATALTPPTVAAATQISRHSSLKWTPAAQSSQSPLSLMPVHSTLSMIRVSM